VIHHRYTVQASLDSTRSSSRTHLGHHPGRRNTKGECPPRSGSVQWGCIRQAGTRPTQGHRALRPAGYNFPHFGAPRSRNKVTVVFCASAIQM